MKAIVTVVGYDTVGILAKVSTVCAANNANIIDVTQSVLKEMFTMVMLID
ncbi:MAG: ACT domain-containing protein, partial [Clostridia bacterium]|nr:ACT domain-containing protein [Clostridia bacterium]